MIANTWPDPARPGVPMNPEKDGWHWLKTGHGVAPWMWREDPQSITWGMGWETNEEVFAPGDIARVPGTIYLGPCLTPDEAAALQARADRNAAGFARVDAEAERDKFLHKQEIAALQKRVAKLEALLKRADDIANWTGEDLIYAGRSYGSVVQTYKNERAALEGKKDE